MTARSNLKTWLRRAADKFIDDLALPIYFGVMGGIMLLYAFVGVLYLLGEFP